MANLRWLLAPFSWLYGLGVYVRHSLYDEHILPSFSVSVPTIGIGNLAVGGTGKTPHTEWLVSQLMTRYRVAVLSRGYGRKTHGFLLADEHANAQTIGDEPMQIHRKFPDIPVAVCENRVRGVKQLMRQVPDIEVVILDDALQHRALRCGMYILLTAADNLYITDHLLPWGRLRDLQHRSLAAQAVVITKCPDSMRPIDKRVIDNRLHLPTYQKLYFSHTVFPKIETAATKPLAISGIARPDEFFDQVRRQFPKAECMAYRDHHRFTRRDQQAILAAAAKHDCVLTTEKDYERLLLTDIPAQLGDKLQVIPIAVDLRTDAPNLLRQVTYYIDETLRHNKNTNKQ